MLPIWLFICYLYVDSFSNHLQVLWIKDSIMILLTIIFAVVTIIMTINFVLVAYILLISDVFWWFQTCFIFHFMYGIIMIILPIDELHHFSRWLLHHQSVNHYNTIINHY